MAQTAEEWVFGNEEVSTQPTETTAPVTETKETEATQETTATPEGDKPKAGSEDKTPKEPVIPKDAKSDDIDRRGAAFAKMRHSYQNRLSKVERERDSLKAEIEALKKERDESNSYVEQSLITREIKNQERRLETITDPDEEWEALNEVSLEDAKNILPEDHLDEYEKNILPYRNNLYSQLTSLAPKLKEVLLENEFAPAIEMALASPHANEILKALNGNTYKEVERKCRAYVSRLFPKEDLKPATQTSPEVTTVPETKPEAKKVSTPSVTPKQTTDTKIGDIPDLNEVSSWF